MSSVTVRAAGRQRFLPAADSYSHGRPLGDAIRGERAPPPAETLSMPTWVPGCAAWSMMPRRWWGMRCPSPG